MREQQILVMFDTDVYKACRIGREIAVAVGFDKVAIAEIASVATELATNLLNRTIDGDLIIREIQCETGLGLEIISTDKGPGLSEVSSAMPDEEPSAGILGPSLSSVKRLMDELDLQSVPGKGTVVTARKWLVEDYLQRMNFSVLARPYPGEAVSGDAWFIRQTDSFSLFVLIDALGHGAGAHEVAVQLQYILEDSYTLPLLEIVRICHEKLRHSRGSAMALGMVNFAKNSFEHISIGNVETRVYGTPQLVRPFCLNGTLGMAMDSPVVTNYPCTAGATIVMFTDGIKGNFTVDPHLLAKPPLAIATHVFDNFRREKDDMTVLVGRWVDA